MSKIPYLIRRGDTLYFRIRVPSKLQLVIQRKEVVQSLRTQNRQEATPVALDLAGKAKMIFNRISQDMKEKGDCNKAIDELIEIGESSRDELRIIAAEAKNTASAPSLQYLLNVEYKLRRRLSGMQDEMIGNSVAAATDRIQGNKDLLDTKLKAVKLIKSERSEVSRLAGESQEMRIENKLMKELFDRGDSSIGREVTKTPHLYAAIDEFERENYENLKVRTRQKYQTALKILKGLVADKPIRGIDHFEMNSFFNEVAKIPPTRYGKFKGMTYKEMIAANDGMGLHKETFNGHKTCINMFIRYCKEKHRGAFGDVSLIDIKYKGDRVDSEKGQRSFKDDELSTLFKCKEMKIYCADSKQVDKFWLPVIGLYTGMRANEICQLNPFTDIINENGIWYFLVSQNTEGAPDITKSVKSGNERQVPVHSKLIDLGLLDYTEAVMSAGFKRMFPKDTPHNNGAGGNTARNFRRFIEDIGLRDEATDARIVGMHAFRKTIITKAYKNEFVYDLLSIVGHESDNRDEFGKKLPNVTLKYIDDEAMQIPLLAKKETIEKVAFDIEFYKPVKPIFR